MTFDNLGEAAQLELGMWPPEVPEGQHFSVVDVLPRLLALLATRKLRATFFVEGLNAQMYPQALLAIAAAGHEVALHAWRHEEWAALDAESEVALLERATAAMRDIGIEPRGFRPPGGGLTERTLGLLAERGYSYVSPAGEREGLRESLAVLPFRWPLVDAYSYLPQFAGLRERYGEGPAPHTPEQMRAKMSAALERHSGQTGRSGQEGHSEQAGHSGRVSHSEQTGRSGQEGHSEQAGHSGRVSHSEQTGRSGQEGHSEQAGHSGRVSHSEQTGRSGQEGHSEQAGHSGRVSHSEQTGRSGQEGHSEQAGHSGRVSHSEQTGRSGQEDHSERVSHSEQAGHLTLLFHPFSVAFTGDPGWEALDSVLGETARLAAEGTLAAMRMDHAAARMLEHPDDFSGHPPVLDEATWMTP